MSNLIFSFIRESHCSKKVMALPLKDMIGRKLWKKIIGISIFTIVLIFVAMAALMLKDRYDKSMSEEEARQYCKINSESKGEFSKYSIDKFDNYIFFVSELNNPELFVFEKDNWFDSRYYYSTDSIGLVDDKSPIGMIIVYLKLNNVDEGKKELVIFFK